MRLGEAQRHRAADLQYINDPISQYYIPYPGDTMTCAELTFNRDRLEAQIAQWIDWQQYETNATAVSNIDQIIAIQTEKNLQYATKINANCMPEQPPTNGGGSTTTNKNYLLWILVAAAAVMFILMRKKRQTA